MNILENSLEAMWLECKEKELYFQQQRREIEQMILEKQPELSEIRINQSVKRTWNQAELEDISRTTNVPMFDYFETEYVPRKDAIKSCMEHHPEHWEHLRKALIVKENKPTFTRLKSVE